MKQSKRLEALAPYLFTVVDALKEEVKNQGIEIIDLSMGSPDKSAPKHVIETLCTRAQLTYNHGYSRKYGSCECELRQTIANWYAQRFNIHLNPQENILPLIGSKEGIANLALAFLNIGDLALVPSPCYPIHFNSVLLAGGTVYNLPLLRKNKYLPMLENIPDHILAQAKLMFINYPHNPTTAVADIHFYEKVVSFARKHNLILASDLAYSEITYNPEKYTPSLLEVKDSLNSNIIEFHTLSKTYNMAGWRMAFAVGNASILAGLEKIKTYSDFGIFRPIQYAAISALSGDQEEIRNNLETYKTRINYFCKALNQIGWEVDKPEATFYIWAKIPSQYKDLSSLDFVSLLLRKTGVVLSPGSGFGEHGENHIRFSLVQEMPLLKKAIERLGVFFSKK